MSFEGNEYYNVRTVTASDLTEYLIYWSKSYTIYGNGVEQYTSCIVVLYGAA